MAEAATVGEGHAPGVSSDQPTEKPVNVVVVGPPLDTMGGMTSVVRQTLGLAYDGRYAAYHVPTTHSSQQDEHSWRKLRRHRDQVDRLRRVVQELDARIVHIHTCSGFSFYRSLVDVLAARRSRRRTVLHVHGAQFDEFFHGSPAPARWSICWGLSRADCVIALSLSWRDKLLAMAPAANVSVIENAVAISDARPGREGRRAAPCHFVVLARMDDWKGIDDALEASRELAQRDVDFRLTLAGPEGTAGDAVGLGEKIRSLGLARQVRYVGPVEGAAKSNLLESADVYLLPSHHEGMPISLLEALAHGLPIVGTLVGAVPEVVEDGVVGLLVPPKSPVRLAKAMATFATDVDRRTQAADAARQLARARFSLGRFERELVALYDDLLGSSPPGAVMAERRGAAHGTLRSSVGSPDRVDQPQIIS